MLTVKCFKVGPTARWYKLMTMFLRRNDITYFVAYTCACMCVCVFLGPASILYDNGEYNRSRRLLFPSIASPDIFPAKEKEDHFDIPPAHIRILYYICILIC